MPPENDPEVTETEPKEPQTTEPPATETEQDPKPVVTPAEPTVETQLPDDHPLVKTLATQRDELKTLRQAGVKVTELEAQITELTPKAEALAPLQARYDRLEAFLTSLGGPISRALDSKSFSTALFESDTDIKELIAQWHKDNPTATSTALSSSANALEESSKDMNSLLRSAAQ